MNRQRLLLLGCCLLLLFPACQGPSDGQLTIVFPSETTERTGGQLLQVMASLVDHDDQPVERATVQAELRAPNGDVLAVLSCTDRGQGRYSSAPLRLPLRGAGGTWRVIVRATWGNGKQARGERTFTGLPSISEKILKRYGFWIEPPHLFEYNEIHPTDPHFEEHSYKDGGGYVLLENNLPEGVNITIVNLDVHWRRADFPADEAAAIAHVRSLAVTSRHDSDPPHINLTAEPATFQGRPAWRVTGQWEGVRVAKSPPPSGPAEWIVFRCPDSPHAQRAARDWLWTLVISTNQPAYMDDLRTLRETFECPTSKSG